MMIVTGPYLDVVDSGWVVLSRAPPLSTLRLSPAVIQTVLAGADGRPSGPVPPTARRTAGHFCRRASRLVSRDVATFAHRH